MTQAILAGFLIGIGDIALMSSVNIYIGAFLFCVALECIIYFELPLYTGKIGFALKNRQWAGYALGLIFNVVGATLALWMYTLISPNNVENVKTAIDLKFSGQTYVALFVAGVFCNVLIHLAVSTKHTIIVILCVMAFIVCGFRHSIADSAYAFYSMDLNIVASWLFVLLGNTVGAIATEWMLTFLEVEKEESPQQSDEDIPEASAVEEPGNNTNMFSGLAGMMGGIPTMSTDEIVDEEKVQSVEETNNGNSTESE